MNDDDDDTEMRMSKKSRVDEEESMEGDNDTPSVPGGLRLSSLQVPKRGAKRHVNIADEGDWEMSQDKRARKGSLAVPESDALEVDEAAMDAEPSDEVYSTIRGTKREREELDSVAGDDVAERSQPSRKRRDDGKGRVAEIASRGRKRDRSIEKLASGEEESDERYTQAMRRKRGRQHTEPEPDEDTEMVALDVALDASESDDMPDIANDPACGGRRIGEVWEVNGQSFKVGLDGRRLRHALVKQQRTKFPMVCASFYYPFCARVLIICVQPKDSAHNDARTHVDVVFEKWLNDEEYNQAKERFELAWQDSSPATTPVKAEGTLSDDRVGKRLLWKGPATSPVKGRASMGPSSNGRNPFELAPSNSGRRVTSAHVFLNVPGESPKLRTSNSFSKWEKQDMEANSLKRMRARLEKEKKEKEQQKDQEKQNREAEKAKFSLPSVPTSAPLAPTTNKPTVETKSTPVPAPTTPPIQTTKTTTVAPAPSGTPASSTPAGSIPNFFAKPPTTPATAAAPGATTQPSATTSSLTTTPQNAFTGTTAPTAAKPSFSFGPLTTTTAPGTSAPSEASQGNTPAKPTFNFGSPAPSMPSATASSASAPAAPTPTSGAAKPTFSFGTPSGQTTTSATTSDVSKAPPAFSFATPPASATMSSEQGKSAIPANPFAAKPATQPSSTLSFPPAGNLSSPFSNNQSSQSQQQTTQNKPTFQFGTPSTPNNAQDTSGTTQSKTDASSSSSLLNRLGPAPVLSQQPSQQSTTTPTQNAWSSPFGGGTVPSTSIFGQSQSQPQQGPSNVSPNKSSPFAPSQPGKSVFGQPSMMGSQSAFSFGKASASAPDPSKPAVVPSPFALAPQSGSPSIFGQPHSQSSASASPSTSVFGQPSGQSGTVASQPVVPVFGQPSGQSSAFASQQAASSVFGKASGETLASQKAGSLVFGKANGETSASQQAGSSVFGKATGETSQKAGSSVFGKGSGETSALQQAGSSVFGKPGGQSDASASQPKAPFSFSFGASSNSSSTSTTNTNPFQAAPSPATTVQANPAATNNSYAFGQPSANTSNTMPTTSAFGFNKPAEEEKK